MIYAKLDYYTVMVTDKTFREILITLNIDCSVYEEFFGISHEVDRGYVSNISFRFNGISIDVNKQDYINALAASGSHNTEVYIDGSPLNFTSSFFDFRFSKVRVNMSGSGLEYLRESIDIDSFCMDPFGWGAPESFKVTRADFAFDFVNYQPDFVKNLVAFLNTEAAAGNMRLKNGKGSGVSYSIRTGDQLTAYFGGSGSDKIVRIYDKKMEYTKNGVLLRPYPLIFLQDHDNNIDSWFRIEFQCRRKSADSYLYSANCLIHVLKVIFNDYLIRDRQGKPLQFMLDLYDWDSLPTIIQNAKYAKPKSTYTKAHEFVLGNALRSIIVLSAVHGWSGLRKMINEILKYRGNSLDIKAEHSTNALGIALSSLFYDEGIPVDDLHITTTSGTVNTVYQINDD